MHDASERLQLIALSFRALGKNDWQGMRSAPVTITNSRLVRIARGSQSSRHGQLYYPGCHMTIIPPSMDIPSVTAGSEGGLRCIGYLRWGELHTYMAVHELSHLVLEWFWARPKPLHHPTWDAPNPWDVGMHHKYIVKHNTLLQLTVFNSTEYFIPTLWIQVVINQPSRLLFRSTQYCLKPHPSLIKLTYHLRKPTLDLYTVLPYLLDLHKS